MQQIQLTRRKFLGWSAGAAALYLAGCNSQKPIGIDSEGRLIGTGLSDPFAGGTFIETVPFTGEPDFPTGVREYQGLDGRVALDLSQLKSTNVSTEDFYIRTFPPPQLRVTEDWSVRLHGLVEKTVDVSVSAIRDLAEPLGSVMMECAGNGGPLKFGLISSAQWTGVPLEKVLEKARPTSEATRILISGFDGKQPASTHSTPGASWVFTPEQLTEAGAFLAVEMNDTPLNKDHGAPVRLIVPGWYGCTCVKWLNEIRWVNEEEPATAQMKEFALRTHQQGEPEMAAEYLPASVDRTAVPTRVEKWKLDGKTVYRVVGLTWGSAVEDGELGISFTLKPKYEPLTTCGPLSSARDWAFWSHRWEPSETGEHLLRLKLLGSDAQTRRLDMRFYARSVVIDEIA